MPRWSQYETEKLSELRRRMGDRLSTYPQYPDVTGDRKLLKFLRGHDYNMDKVTAMYTKFLDWRDANCVNEIRENIVRGKLDHPMKFPLGEVILKNVPQLLITHNTYDHEGQPICVEKYDFSVNHMYSLMTMEQYVTFLIHSLEYKSMIVEQTAEKREREYLASLSEEDLQLALSEDFSDPDVTERTPYGCMLTTCMIRDLSGLGFEHLGAKGQETARALLTLSSDNYPESMGKCHTINAPWIFNTAWMFIKVMLSARTIAKVNVIARDPLKELEKYMDKSAIPKVVGGTCTDGESLTYQPFIFDADFLVPPNPDSARGAFRSVCSDAGSQPISPRGGTHAHAASVSQPGSASSSAHGFPMSPLGAQGAQGGLCEASLQALNDSNELQMQSSMKMNDLDWKPRSTTEVTDAMTSPGSQSRDMSRDMSLDVSGITLDVTE